jgi:hypothetical protein
VADPVYNWERDEHFPLLVNLQRVAATAGRVPREDQLSTFLAWLCSLSEVVTREVVDLFLAEDDEALVAAADNRPRVATQIRLPGGLFADVSFAWPQRALQLLVEVKLDAPFGLYWDVAGTVTAQPEEYAQVWTSCVPRYEAVVRRVGTLTADGLPDDGRPQSASAVGAVRRAGDVRWLCVRDHIRRLLDADEVEVDARAAARELDEYLTQVFERPSAKLLHDAERVMIDFAQQLAATEFPSATLSNPHITRQKQTFCVQGTISPVLVAGEELILWLAFTVARSTYSPLGWPDAIQIAFFSDDGKAIGQAAGDCLLDAGFELQRDRGNWLPLRTRLNWAELPTEDRAGYVLGWARGRLAPLPSDAPMP